MSGAWSRGAYRGGGRHGGRVISDRPNKHVRFNNHDNNSSARDSGWLSQFLQNIDGSQYPRYKDLTDQAIRFTQNAIHWMTLTFDHVQGDPFASPSRIRATVPQSFAQFPAEWMSSPIRRVALTDYLLRQIGINLHAIQGGFDDDPFSSNSNPQKDGDEDDAQMSNYETSSGKRGYHNTVRGGDFRVARASQHVVERSAVVVNDQFVELRLLVSLPARGRRILGYEAEKILTRNLPELIRRSFLKSSLDGAAVWAHIVSVEEQEYVRNSLNKLGLCAFVRNGAILPRKSGVSDHPLQNAIPFESPCSLVVEFELPISKRKITGMGIRKGVTLIVGGGFHGKSTLLRALEVGVYNHIPGDGREFVCTDPNAVKIRAEDGRSVSNVDISMFINNLPTKIDSSQFSTTNASGSTSQATNILENLEAGASTLLFDEDTCATNFMVRDGRMQMVVSKDKEPITPFVTRVRQLYDQINVSSILVVGGTSSYFETADTVVMMDCFHPYDVTNQVREICQQYVREGSNALQDDCKIETFLKDRVPLPNTLIPRASLNDYKFKVQARSFHTIQLGHQQEIEVNYVEQLVERGQTIAIADSLVSLLKPQGGGSSQQEDIVINGHRSMKQILAAYDQILDHRGLDAIAQFQFSGILTRPRRFELAAALNRCRNLKFSHLK